MCVAFDESFSAILGSSP